MTDSNGAPTPTTDSNGTPTPNASAVTPPDTVTPSLEERAKAEVAKLTVVAKEDIEKIRETLINLGHMAKDDAAVTDQKVLAAAGQLLVMYNTVLKDATIMMQHTVSVYESMTTRLGMIPDELNKTSVVFKAREGWADLKHVIAAAVQFFHKQDGTPPNVQVKSDTTTQDQSTPTE